MTVLLNLQWQSVAGGNKVGPGGWATGIRILKGRDEKPTVQEVLPPPRRTVGAVPDEVGTGRDPPLRPSFSTTSMVPDKIPGMKSDAGQRTYTSFKRLGPLAALA